MQCYHISSVFPLQLPGSHSMPTSVKGIPNLAWATVAVYEVRIVGKICVDVGKNNRIDCKHIKIEIPNRDLICTTLACQCRRR